MLFKYIKPAAVSALVLLSVVGMSNTAFANNQAKSNKIKRQLNACQNKSQSASGANYCLEEATNRYVALMNKTQKAKFRSKQQECRSIFGDPRQEAAAFASEGFECELDVAKAVLKVK